VLADKGLATAAAVGGAPLSAADVDAQRVAWRRVLDPGDGA
jgi:hypothetical protein